VGKLLCSLCFRRGLHSQAVHEWQHTLPDQCLSGRLLLRALIKRAPAFGGVGEWRPQVSAVSELRRNGITSHHIGTWASLA
jgi:hypothetical protein